MVMDITFECDGVTMHHIGKVLDCWFESGSMPFAQFHYPFENKEKFEDGFPADFITEAIDQTRGWFYSLTAVNVALFGKSPYKNLICTGFINAADGKKMSKKLKNYTDPMELMDKYSADSFRMLMLTSPLTRGEDFALSDKDVGDVARKLGMIWNMYDFFTMYAEVDKWEFDGDLSDPSKILKNPLDIWIVSRMHQVIKEVGAKMQSYELADAVRPILPFIDDASNWYVRRSRRRFWKSGETQDKNHAYRTLHYVLAQLSMLLAPFTPFLADELYQKLTGGESVHLLDWPKAGNIDERLVDDMQMARDYITEGLAKRAAAGIKVRQPLKHVVVPELPDEYKDVIAEELNVKEVTLGKEVKLDTHLTPELKREGMMREVIRQVQNARKNAGLQIDDRIVLSLATSDDELKQAIEEHKEIVMAETLATSLLSDEGGKEISVDGATLNIDVKKA
jgi:isoleucyl-tRNA synthetase